jgi:LAO/AO transport system kinase
MLLSLDEHRKERAWKPPILKTVASSGEGVPALADALAEHIAYLKQSGQLGERGTRQARSEILALLHQALLQRLDATIPAEEWQRIVADVVARRTDPYAASAQLAERIDLTAPSVPDPATT